MEEDNSRDCDLDAGFSLVPAKDTPAPALRRGQHLRLVLTLKQAETKPTALANKQSIVLSHGPDVKHLPSSESTKLFHDALEHGDLNISTWCFTLQGVPEALPSTQPSRWAQMQLFLSEGLVFCHHFQL